MSGLLIALSLCLAGVFYTFYALWVYLRRPQTCWADPRGDDSTGRRGSLKRPFRTLNGALKATRSGDTVQLAPGTYFFTDSIVLPLHTNLNIQGSSFQAGVKAEWREGDP